MINNTRSDHQPDRPRPDWNTDVLDHPVVLDVPDDADQAVHAQAGTFPPNPNADHAVGGPPSGDDAAEMLDPLLAAALSALVATRDRTRDAHQRIGDLGRAGVVALRTPAGSLEIRETLLGWILVRCWGDPDRYDLAGAARLRAWRLAAERRDCGTDNYTDTGYLADTDGPTGSGASHDRSGVTPPRQWPGSAAGPDADGESTP